MKEYLKKITTHIPYPLGRCFSLCPMELRLGHQYRCYKNEINYSNEDIRGLQLKRIKDLVAFAYDNIQFYKEYYQEQESTQEGIYSLSDIERISIVAKSDLQKVPLEYRSAGNLALKKSNTGGTTGQPLDFYLEKTAYAREWAHMHAIWKKLGYRYTDEKITIRGKNIGKQFYKYNFNQNEFLINAYVSILDNLDTCRKLITKHNIKWIHGYPSSIYSFLRELENTDSVLFEVLINKIQGVFLGSEYPAPQYRNYIERHCNLKSISWYGHSEMAVLAPELEPGSGVYYPFHSYGYAEAVPCGDSYRLVATSLHNYASPFIRYDTGDLIEPTFKDGLLESFRIKEGRNSDSVVDKNGRDISLTGLIFGRHHKAFDFCEHVQIRQTEPGRIEVLVTSRKESMEWSELFDFSNALFDVNFIQISSPVRTSQGKVQLLLR